MNTAMMLSVLSAVVLGSAGGLLGLLLWVAILAVVIWAIVALLAWAGMVRIILIALGCIVAIVLIFRALGFVI